jgi:hypothetical protein
MLHPVIRHNKPDKKKSIDLISTPDSKCGGSSEKLENAVFEKLDV